MWFKVDDKKVIFQTNLSKKISLKFLFLGFWRSDFWIVYVYFYIKERHYQLRIVETMSEKRTSLWTWSRWQFVSLLFVAILINLIKHLNWNWHFRLEAFVTDKLIRLIALDFDAERENRIEGDTFCTMVEQLRNKTRKVTCSKRNYKSKRCNKS